MIRDWRTMERDNPALRCSSNRVTVLTRRVLFGVDTIVEFRQLEGMDLDEFRKFKVKNQLLVGVGLAAKAGIPDQKVGPGKSAVFVAGIAGSLFELFREVDRLGGWGSRSGGSSRSHDC